MSTFTGSRPRGGHLGLILPLVSASTSVGVALFQFPLVLAFLQARPKITGKPLSRFWDALTIPAASGIVAFSAISAISGFVSARWLRTHVTLETTSVSNWYIYGSVFAAAHLLGIPFVTGPIKKLVSNGRDIVTKNESDIEEENEVQIRKWLLVHTVRFVLADLPALVCFAEGVAQSFWII